MIFAGIWATVVYFPVASWVFNFGLNKDGSFAYGGWVTNGLQDWLRRRRDRLRRRHRGAHQRRCRRHSRSRSCSDAASASRRASDVPHNPPFVLLGAGLLWFGWFGFNAGSELGADGTAAIAFVNTLAAPAAALLSWLVVEKIRNGKPTSVGAASGAVAGLVAITPACAALTPIWAVVLGLLAGAVCRSRST